MQPKRRGFAIDVTGKKQWRINQTLSQFVSSPVQADCKMAASSSTVKPRVVKLQDDETEQFLALYAIEKVLYDCSIEEYKDRDSRNAAAQRISDALGIPGFGPREVITKFKNLRSSYCQELKKIAESEQAGEVYRPKVFWFDLMHSFIRPFVQKRPTQPNTVLPPNTSEESQPEQSQSPSQHQNAIDDFDDSATWTPQIASVMSETPRIALKRKTTPPTIIQPPSKLRRNLNESQIDFMSLAIEKLEGISNRAQRIAKEDSYDCYGKYVASMLRSMGRPMSMRLEEKITTLMTTAVCPLPTSSSRSTQPTIESEPTQSTSDTETSQPTIKYEWFY